jgi:hypothetical protein
MVKRVWVALLDCVARALTALPSPAAQSAPAITSLIVNKRTRYPGDGFGQYIGGLCSDFRR